MAAAAPSSSDSPKRILDERGLRPRKHLGQNFLVDPRVAARIAASLPEGSHAIEIGGGTGSLTAALLSRARSTVVVELDRGLAGVLRERFAGDARCSVVEGDALSFDLAGALSRAPPPRAVCGNLPYYITTPLLERVFAAADWWETAVFMVQREYGRRLSAEPGGKEYGSLTVFAAYHCHIEHLFDVGAGGFYPAPEVASSVIRLRPRRDRAAGVRDEGLFLGLVRAAFAQRRKMLLNSVAGSTWDHADNVKATLRAGLQAAGLDAAVRAERLGLQDFIRLANALHDAGFPTPGVVDVPAPSP